MRVVALGDAFKDRIGETQDSPEGPRRARRGRRRERCFVGLDAYQKVIATDVNYVILATPPGFRPEHLKAAVAAGKNIFTEKPVAVDGPGIRTVLAAYEEAKKKGLGIGAGTQRRHQAGYLETMKRVQDGAIGDIVVRPLLLEPGRPLERSRGRPSGPTSSGRCATGSTSPGSPATTSSSSTSTTSTWSTGPWARTRVSALGMGGRQVAHRPRLRPHLRPLRHRLRVPERRAHA